MTFQGNREFINALKETGDVVCVKKEVDWDLEAGAIYRRAMELSGPATLFEKIKGYPQGYRIFGDPLATYRRVAVVLGNEDYSKIRISSTRAPLCLSANKQDGRVKI